MKTKWQTILFAAIFMATMPIASKAQQAATPDQNGPSQASQSTPDQSAPDQAASPNRPARTNPFKSLNLTPQQKTQMKAIRAQQKDQLQALRNNASLSDQQRRQQFHQIRRDAHRQMVAVLTPNQKAQLKQMIQERRAARMQSPPQSGAEAPAQSAAPQSEPSAPSTPSNPQ